MGTDAREWKQEDEEKKFEDDIFDTLIEYQIEEQLSMNLPNPFGTKTYPVQIVSHKDLPNSPLIAPLYDSSGEWQTDQKGKPLGYIRVEQKIQTLIDGQLNIETRVANIKGTIDFLLNHVKSNQWKDGNLFGGKIVIKESFEPQWKGHSPDVDKCGKEKRFIVNGKSYPVYRENIYTENVNEADKLVTEEQARIFANSIDNMIVDDLPF